MKSIVPALIFCLAILSFVPPVHPEEFSSPGPAASPSPVPGRIRVEVLSQLGKAIPEARVTLYELAGPRKEDPYSCGSWEMVVPTAVAPGVFEQEAAGGTYRIEASGDEWIGAVAEKVDLKAGETREVKFSLESGSVISGRVSDAEGNPLSGAQVSYSHSGFQQSTWFRSRAREKTTDSSGWFSFRDLPPGVYDLKIAQSGYIAAEVADLATGTVDLEVAMKEGFAIRGRLEGDLEGLESPVRLKLKAAGIPGRRTFSRSVKLGSGKDFEISGLERGIYSVRLQEKDHLSGWVRQVAARPLDEARPITLTVARGGSISGRVTEAGTEDPLAGVSLQLIPEGGKTGDFKSSNRRGEFIFRGVEGGEYTLQARIWQDPYPKFRREKKIKIDPGQKITDLDLKLEVGRKITFNGAVLDERDDPVEEADVRINFRPVGEKSYRQNFRDRAESESSGEFTLSAYLESAGGEVMISAGKKGYGPAEKRIELAPDQVSIGGIVLVLDYGVTLEVEVGGEEGGGRTIPSAIVALNSYWSEEEETRNYVNLKKLTDGAGRCRFDHLAPGGYRLEVSKPGYSPRKEKVKLVAGEPVKTVSLVLDEGRTLLVRVKNESGEAVEGAAISAREKTGGFEYMMGGMSGKNRTDSSGVCLLRDLPAAPLTLAVEAEGYVSIRRHRVGENQDEVEVTLKGAGAIRGRFVNSSGRPLADVDIIARKRAAGPRSLGSTFFQTKDLGDGVFQAAALPTGSYDLTIRSKDRAGKKIEAVEVEAGEETDLGEIVLGPGSTISGRVRTQEEGSPLKGAWVRVEGPAGGMNSILTTSDMTDPEGGFALEGLSPGTYVLMANAKNYRSAKTAGITVETGEEKKIADIHLSRLTEAEREELARQRHIIPSLGVRIAETGTRGETEPPSSLVIEEVLPGTAAANSGLSAGDEIVKINGKTIAEEPMEFFQGLMAAPGTEIKVTVKRAESGREEEVDLTVDQWSKEDIIRQAIQAD